MIDQRRFAGIGTADDGDADRPLGNLLIGLDEFVVVEFFLLGLGLRHQAAQRVVKLAQSLAVLGRDLDRLAEPQRVGLHRAGIALLALAFVGDQNHRFVGAAGELGKGTIVRRQPGARVDQEHHRVGKSEYHPYDLTILSAILH